MNKNNYVSLEVAQRLVDAGIVLETDMSWYFRNNEWILRQSGSVYEGNISIPAPCFAELWRELPWFALKDGGVRNLQVKKYKTFTAVCYDGTGSSYININPADAIAELLILVK